MNDNNLRKIWFISRPQRDPVFHEEALTALASVTENFSLKWYGNKDLQKKYEQALIHIGVKRNSISKDASTGRTWAAMLKSLAYCYSDSKGYLIPTKCALEILKGHNVFDNIKKQILTFQIPNAYFLSSDFAQKFCSDFSILPVRFLIKLCTKPQLSFYITKREITYIVMTARKDSELSDTVNKIIQYRNMSDIEKEQFEHEVALQYEHRERSDKASRNFYKAHSDDAHTFMLISEYTQLVDYERGVNSKLFIPESKLNNTIAEIKYYDSRYPFNNRYLFSLERMAEVNGLDVNSYKASRYGDIKPATNMDKKIKKAQKLLEAYPNASELSNDEIIHILSSSSFSISDSQKISEHISSSTAMENINRSFIEGVLNETDNLEFENKIGRIFQQLGFKVIMHPKVCGERTEIDIMLEYDDGLCGIIDAKNYKEKFSLSSALSSHMTSEYIPNYKNYKGNTLTFFGYAVCSDIGGIANLEKISDKSSNKDIKGIIINAKTLLGLLDYCIENNISPDKRVKLFLELINNEAFSSFGQVMAKLNLD